MVFDVLIAFSLVFMTFHWFYDFSIVFIGLSSVFITFHCNLKFFHWFSLLFIKISLLFPMAPLLALLFITFHCFVLLFQGRLVLVIDLYQWRRTTHTHRGAGGGEGQKRNKYQ